MTRRDQWLATGSRAWLPGKRGPDARCIPLASARRAVVGLTEIFEDSVDLLGATLREEAARIPGLLFRPAAGILAAAAGAVFLTAAAAFYFRDLFGGWHLSFLVLGAFYVLLGVVVWKAGRADQ